MVVEDNSGHRRAFSVDFRIRRAMRREARSTALC
jgi:hypothetical protein